MRKPNSRSEPVIMDIAELLRSLAVSAVPILIAITFHEAAHGYAAHRLGDNTAKALGRLTLNPVAHIDPIGTILLPLMMYLLTSGQFVFGYARPVPINPYNFRDPRKGMALSAAAGPGTNILLAIASVVIYKYAMLPFGASMPEAVYEPLMRMVKASIYINVIFAALNLLPVPPLDGGRVVAGLLPREQANAYEKLEPYGMIIVIILLVTNIAKFFILPVATGILYLLSFI